MKKILSIILLLFFNYSLTNGQGFSIVQKSINDLATEAAQFSQEILTITEQIRKTEEVISNTTKLINQGEKIAQQGEQLIKKIASGNFDPKDLEDLYLSTEDFLESEEFNQLGLNNVINIDPKLKDKVNSSIHKVKTIGEAIYMSGNQAIDTYNKIENWSRIITDPKLIDKVIPEAFNFDRSILEKSLGEIDKLYNKCVKNLNVSELENVNNMSSLIYITNKKDECLSIFNENKKSIDNLMTFVEEQDKKIKLEVDKVLFELNYIKLKNELKINNYKYLFGFYDKVNEPEVNKATIFASFVPNFNFIPFQSVGNFQPTSIDDIKNELPYIAMNSIYDKFKEFIEKVWILPFLLALFSFYIIKILYYKKDIYENLQSFFYKLIGILNIGLVPIILIAIYLTFQYFTLFASIMLSEDTKNLQTFNDSINQNISDIKNTSQKVNAKQTLKPEEVEQVTNNSVVKKAKVNTDLPEIEWSFLDFGKNTIFSIINFLVDLISSVTEFAFLVFKNTIIPIVFIITILSYPLMSIPFLSQGFKNSASTFLNVISWGLIYTIVIIVYETLGAEALKENFLQAIIISCLKIIVILMIPKISTMIFGGTDFGGDLTKLTALASGITYMGIKGGAKKLSNGGKSNSNESGGASAQNSSNGQGGGGGASKNGGGEQNSNSSPKNNGETKGRGRPPVNKNSENESASKEGGQEKTGSTSKNSKPKSMTKNFDKDQVLKELNKTRRDLNKSIRLYKNEVA